MPVKKKQKSDKKQNRKDARFLVYTDGGCLVNPGGVGAFGYVVIDQETGEYIEDAVAFDHTTNNRMEIMGVIAALERVGGMAPGASVHVFTDSMYVINLVKHEPGNRATNEDLWARYDRASAGFDLAFTWVRGHNGNTYNERCDELATEAMHGEVRFYDYGYKGPSRASGMRFDASSGTQNKGGAMAVKIDVSSTFEDHGEGKSASQYSVKYGVNLSCASQILDFYQRDRHGFKDYMALKTGGIDQWSRVSGADLVEKVGPEVSSAAAVYLGNEKQLLSCLKWRCRGLALSDAIRKVLVDTEVSNNCNRYR